MVPWASNERRGLELEQFGFTDVSLMDGEHIDSALELAGNPEVIVLTDRRIIHIRGDHRCRRAEFASIQDIDAVELGVEEEGHGAFIWAALAFIVAVPLYFVIDHSVGRVAAPLAAALLGVYLIADRQLAPGTPTVVFKAGSSQLRCDLRNQGSPHDVYDFINRLFEIKDRDGTDHLRASSRFLPR